MSAERKRCIVCGNLMDYCDCPTAPAVVTAPLPIVPGGWAVRRRKKHLALLMPPKAKELVPA